MTTIARRITGGVDTHLDTHVAAALDERGAQLGVQSFPATAKGYRDLLDWLEGFGTVDLIGVEGDRQANSALWHIVFTRMVNDPRTKHYIERRMKEGRTKKEAIRCLKRYVAREVFAALPRSEFTLDSP